MKGSNVGREDACRGGLQKGCNEGQEDCRKLAMVSWKNPKKAGRMIELMVFKGCNAGLKLVDLMVC